MRLYAVLLLFLPVVVLAGVADVIDVTIEARGNRLYRFEVTITHEDRGWDHHVDKWEVVGPDDTVLAKRSFFNPREGGEAKFTSALVGVKIPDGINEVTIRAHDKVHAYQGKTVTVAVPKSNPAPE